jgi:hypothetical protein
VHSVGRMQSFGMLKLIYIYRERERERERETLWSIGQSSWLLTQKSWVRFRRYEIGCVAVGLERGPLSLVGINEEVLERKVAAPVRKTEINDRGGSAALTTRHPSIRNSWH